MCSAQIQLGRELKGDNAFPKTLPKVTATITNYKIIIMQKDTNDHPV